MTEKDKKAFAKNLSLAGAEGLDMGDDAPAVQGVDGGGKGRLLAFRNSVADLFEKGPL